MISYHRHNEELRCEHLIKELKKGKSIAVVSDAGTPGISDPGEEVVKECIKENIKIVPIPGACAFVNALITSGISTKEFCFYGFLPLNKKNRKEKIEEIRNINKTVILYEAPHKIKNTLEDLKKVIDKDRKVVLAREITKIHEEYVRGNIDEILSNVDNLKGEMVLIIEGNYSEKENDLCNLSIKEHYKYYQVQGLDKKEIIKKIAKDRNVNKNEIYKLFVNKEEA